MIKLHFCLRRLPHLTREEFQHYWRHQHGKLVEKHRYVLKIERYVQFYGSDPQANPEASGTRGGPEPFDGVAMSWWRDAQALAEMMQNPAALKASAELLADEKKFIDLARSPVTWGEDHVIFG